MARMVYIEQIKPNTFLHFTTDGPSFRLRDYSQSASSPPEEVMRQGQGDHPMTADDIRTLAKQPGNYNLDPPEPGRDLNDIEYWHRSTIDYNNKYILDSRNEDAVQTHNGSLDREVAYYLEHQGEWHEHEGEHVLIRGEEVIGFFPSRDTALSEGFRRFGRVAFLVKGVKDEEEPRPMVRMIL